MEDEGEDERERMEFRSSKLHFIQPKLKNMTRIISNDFLTPLFSITVIPPCVLPRVYPCVVALCVCVRECIGDKENGFSTESISINS